MVRRIFVVWFIANFLIIGILSLLARQWYIGWTISPIAKIWVELVFLMLPNFLLPIFIFRYGWEESTGSVKNELGWVWKGWRNILVGIVMFAVLYGVIRLTGQLLGKSIPYNLPESGNSIHTQHLLTVIVLCVTILGFVVLTVAGEETMFRGLAQTQIGKRYGTWVGILAAAILFGLRHLPNDIYYAHLWNATPKMWLSREVQLYLTALVLGITRHMGRSTYASAVTHGLLLVTTLFGL